MKATLLSRPGLVTYIDRANQIATISKGSDRLLYRRFRTPATESAPRGPARCPGTGRSLANATRQTDDRLGLHGWALLETRSWLSGLGHYRRRLPRLHP